MITCHLRYEIDPDEIEAFVRFARRWMELVARHGGIHHGYFLPAEGASDIAYALSAFRAWPSMSATASASASIRSSSRRIGSATNRAA